MKEIFSGFENPGLKAIGVLAFVVAVVVGAFVNGLLGWAIFLTTILAFVLVALRKNVKERRK